MNEMLPKLTEADYAWIKEMEARSGHDMSGDYNELPYCVKCMGLEGGLPTHCPGKPMPFDVGDRVYRGEIDYRDGRWVNQPTTAMAHAYGVRREPVVEVEVSGSGEVT